jgi:hypothetical protein
MKKLLNQLTVVDDNECGYFRLSLITRPVCDFLLFIFMLTITFLGLCFLFTTLPLGFRFNGIHIGPTDQRGQCANLFMWVPIDSFCCNFCFFETESYCVSRPQTLHPSASIS